MSRCHSDGHIELGTVWAMDPKSCSLARWRLNPHFAHSATHCVGWVTGIDQHKTASPRAVKSVIPNAWLWNADIRGLLKSIRPLKQKLAYLVGWNPNLVQNIPRNPAIPPLFEALPEVLFFYLKEGAPSHFQTGTTFHGNFSFGRSQKSHGAISREYGACRTCGTWGLAKKSWIRCE